jgi:hypothetical protein
MRDFQKQFREWPDETSNSSNKILGILHYISKRLASFGLRGPGLIIERWRSRMGLISSGFWIGPHDEYERLIKQQG